MRSPIFSQFGETLEGFQTIRAFSKSESYKALMARRIDANTVCVVTLRAAMAWLGVRVDALGAVLCGSVCLLAVLFQDLAHPGWIGLALLYANSMTHTLKMLTGVAAEVESSYNSNSTLSPTLILILILTLTLGGVQFQQRREDRRVFESRDGASGTSGHLGRLSASPGLATIRPSFV